jgi:outer membrane lipoprotein-sorting protein
MVRYTIIFACVVAAAAVATRGSQDAKPQAAKAAAPNPADEKLAAVLEDVDRRAGRAADLAGRFRQEKHTALLKKPMVSAGRIRMKGPVVRWDTEAPEPGVLYSDGREIRMYYPRQSTVEVYPIDQRLSDLAASPLPRLAVLRQHFKIEPAPPKPQRDTPRDDPSQLEIRLTPNDTYLAEHVEEVRVTLDTAAARVTAVDMLDTDGDRTVIRFTDLKTDTGIKAGDLDLVLPAGTKVSRPLDGVQGGDNANHGKQGGGKQ